MIRHRKVEHLRKYGVDLCARLDVDGWSLSLAWGLHRVLVYRKAGTR